MFWFLGIRFLSKFCNSLHVVSDMISVNELEDVTERIRYHLGFECSLIADSNFRVIVARVDLCRFYELHKYLEELSKHYNIKLEINALTSLAKIYVDPKE